MRIVVLRYACAVEPIPDHKCKHARCFWPTALHAIPRSDRMADPSLRVLESLLRRHALDRTLSHMHFPLELQRTLALEEDIAALHRFGDDGEAMPLLEATRQVYCMPLLS